MGGKVFTSGPLALYTPRLCRKVYEQMQEHCFAVLKPMFPLVKSPVEAPEKVTFGDIDILISLQASSFTKDEIKQPDKAAIWAAVKKELRAVRTHQETKLIMNIAIPWPTLNPNSMARQLAMEAAVGESGGKAAVGGAGAVTAGDKAEEETKLRPRAIQVDITLCATDEELEWNCFKFAHGDLWNIVGAMIRPYGLTINDEALFIRIPEIEHDNKKKARIFLTNKPTEALDFLGLPHRAGEWDKPFTSVTELFEYAAGCRWFTLEPREDKRDHENDDVNAKQKALDDARRKLKSNDRQRMRQRPIFARWVEDFVPGCQASGRFVGRSHRTHDSVRDDVRAAAFGAFPGAEEAYTTRLAGWHREKTRIFVKTKLIKLDMALPDSIAHALPRPQEGGGSVEDIEKCWRRVLRSALTRILLQDYQEFEGIVPPQLRDLHGVLLVDDVKEWITENWEAVGRIAWRENCARAAESFRIKKAAAEKEAAEKGSIAITLGAAEAGDEGAGDPSAAGSSDA